LNPDPAYTKEETMKCPACQNEMSQVAVDDITVDVCEGGCGGIWFDQFELQKVDEPQETAGEKLLSIKKDPKISIDFNARRNCPKCENMVMMRHFFSVKKEVVVDECPNCSGIFLDYGELGQIRNQYHTEAERKEAANRYFSEIFGVHLENMRKESEAKAQKAKKIAHLFRFICPSYYIPGKQDWGAF
jgi:Zn-finger nucleic acid-binding protein